MPDGQSILVTGPDRTRVSIIGFNPLGVFPQMGSRDDLIRRPRSRSAGMVLRLYRVEPHRPAELYYTRTIDARPHRLTNFNAAIASRDLGTVETITWQGADGFEEMASSSIRRILTETRSTRWLLEIHGGPMLSSDSGVWGPWWSPASDDGLPGLDRVQPELPRE